MLFPLVAVLETGHFGMLYRTYDAAIVAMAPGICTLFDNHQVTYLSVPECKDQQSASVSLAQEANEYVVNRAHELSQILGFAFEVGQVRKANCGGKVGVRLFD